jgi:hypothetical protein
VAKADKHKTNTTGLMTAPQYIGDVNLATLLNGRFERASLYRTLDGLTVGDLVRMDETSFVAGVKQKDAHIARAFWCAHLVGIRDAYVEYIRLSDMRIQVEMAHKKVDRLISLARSDEVTH